MAILYPPYIDAKLPGQYGDTLYIPFKFNIATGWEDLENKALSVRIKDLNTDKVVYEESFAIYQKNGNIQGNGSVINLEKLLFEINLPSNQENLKRHGGFYKIQFGFCDTEKIGLNVLETLPVIYWSTVGIYKYLENLPEINFKANTLDPYNHTFILSQESPKDWGGEKIYSYSYKVTTTIDEKSDTKEKNNLFMNGKAESEIELEYKTFSNNTKTIEVNAITTNNFILNKTFEVKTDFYNYTKTVEPERQWTIENYDICGGVKITSFPFSHDFFFSQKIVKKEKNSFYDTVIAEEKENLKFFNAGKKLDFFDTISEQGKTYSYFYIFNTPVLDIKGNYRTNVAFFADSSSEEITIDFEDMYLQDEDFMLNIRFNPKVSSFKYVIQEQKTNTLGGQYPIFTRNGNTNYAEFQISGMLSLEADIETLMKSQESRGSTPDNKNVEEYSSAKSFFDERLYKIKVLKWLNNGKAKLFRSAAEGNYIVRITGVSLAPNETLSRKLHTFQATAVEVEGIEKAYKYNFAINFDKGAI